MEQNKAALTMPEAAEKKPEQQREERHIEPEKMWKEFQKGRAFNQHIGLYEEVERNEDFYIGDQWRGVNAPDLEHPTVNVISRVVKFCISSIMSDDIGVGLETFDENEDEKPVLEMLGAQFDAIMEQTSFKKKAREVIRNAAVDGDGCMHFWFDPDAEGGYIGGSATPSETPGNIRAEVLENTNVYFGNPQNPSVEEQPYIILAFRRLVEDVRKAAQENGQDAQGIEADEDENKHGTAPEDGKVTVLRRYWKENGTVWFAEATKTGMVREATDTGYKRFPLAVFGWEKVKSCYHGKSMVTAAIPNQIFINKMFAMAQHHMKTMAFPKVIYDKTKLKAWDNRVGTAIGVAGAPNDIVATGMRAPDMSGQVLEMISNVIEYTRDAMGASDAALGNVKPDNTSAIIATQKATSMPLELQKQDFYAFVEDSVRIWLDMMRVNYGTRMVRLRITQQAMPELGMMGGEQTVTTLYDFGNLNDMAVRLNVEIGAATYWSELMQVQTLDALYASGILTDAEVYLDNMPKGYITGRESIKAAIRKQKEQQQAQQAMPTLGADVAMLGQEGVLA
jgi:hypothetical protein